MPATMRVISTQRDDSQPNMDIIQRYLADVRQYTVLSREEERDLAMQFELTRDADIEQQLINANLRLVVKIAWEYQSNRVSTLDLIQEGNVGLVHAVRKYDHTKNIRLASYAQWWIRAYILKYLMDNHKMIRIGTTQAQRKLFYNLKKERTRLKRQGLVPTVSMLARSLAVRERDIVEMEMRLSGAESSLDAPLQDGENSTLGDVLSSGEEHVEEYVIRDEAADKLQQCLKDFEQTLQGRDIELWHRRMVADSPNTLQEMGELFGVSRERARQLEKRIVRRLETFVRERIADDEPLEFPLFA